MAEESCSLVSRCAQTADPMGDGTLMSLGPEDAGKVQNLILKVLALQQEVDTLKQQRKEGAEARGDVEQTATKLQVDNTKLVKENVTSKSKVAKAHEMLQRLQQQLEDISRARRLSKDCACQTTVVQSLQQSAAPQHATTGAGPQLVQSPVYLAADATKSEEEQGESTFTPRTLRFDCAAGAFVDADSGQQPSACTGCSAPLQASSVAPCNGGSAACSAPLSSVRLRKLDAAGCHAYDSPVQPGLLGAGESLWRLVQDIERLPVCV